MNEVSTANISIKEATTKDIKAIAEISAFTFCETYAAYNTEQNINLYVHENFSETNVLTEYEDPSTLFFLAYYQDILTGYIKLKLHSKNDKSSLEISRLYVLQQYHSNKIDKELMMHCITYAQQQKNEKIWLGVWEQNEKAIRFYTNWGFTISGNIPFQFGDDLQNDYLMEKQL